MRSSWTYRTLSFILAILVGVNSVSWAVVEHYCQGALRTVSLIIETSCCKDLPKVNSDAVACCSSKTSGHADCCTDEVDLIDHDTTVIQPTDDLQDISDQPIRVTPYLEGKKFWPSAKINPVRGPCQNVPPYQDKYFAHIQSWLL